MNAKNKVHDTSLKVRRFDAGRDDQLWDDFVADLAYNGAFVTSRRFLDYHPPGRFQDHSLLVTRGEQLVAVVPACVIDDGGRRTFYSHRGSTFGGIVVARRFFEVTYLHDVIRALDEHWHEHGFAQVVLRQVPSVFADGSVGSLEYLLVLNGFRRIDELSFVVPLAELGTGPVVNLLRDRTRQQLVQGQRAGLTVRELAAVSEIEQFHALLAANLLRHDARPVHSVAEICDLRARFPGGVTLHGCFHGDRLVAGAMMWAYGKRVLHEQNMCTDHGAAELRPGNVLNHHMLELAARMGVPFFSFGISTEDSGRVLNFGLARFKEGFGARGYVNSTFIRASAAADAR